MNWRKRLFIVIAVISFAMIASGCGTQVVSTNKINPIEQGKIGVLIINKGSSYHENFTDTKTISEIISNLYNVNVKKLSRAEDKKVLDSGNILKKDSTITLYFKPDNYSEAQSIAILFSDKELYLPDIKSMGSGNYTVSYINDHDEATLKAIQVIYSLSEEMTSKNNGLNLNELNITYPGSWAKKGNENEIFFDDENKQTVGGISLVGYYGDYNSILPNHSEISNTEDIDISLGKGKLFTLKRSNPAVANNNVTWDEIHAVIPINKNNLAYDIWIKGTEDTLLSILKSINYSKPLESTHNEKWQAVARLRYIEGTIVSLKQSSEGKLTLNLKVEVNYHSETDPVGNPDFPFEIGETVEFTLKDKPEINLSTNKRIIIYQGEITTDGKNDFLGADIKYYEEEGKYFDMNGKEISLPPYDYPNSI